MIQAMNELYRIAEEAARQAGKILLSYYKNDYEIQEKSYHNPVTTADHAADSFLKKFLMKETPDFGWLSEETVDSKNRLGKEMVWVVDPLDGTKEFIEGVPHFVISIGLVHKGKPVLGTIYNPVRDELIQTTPENQVHLNRNVMKLKTASKLSDVACVNSRSETRRGLWESWKDVFRELIPIGSVAYKLALVGTGKQDFFVTLRPKNEWDICAGHAILQANGGILKTVWGEDISYNREKTVIKPGLVGGYPVLVEHFIKAYRAREEGPNGKD